MLFRRSSLALLAPLALAGALLGAAGCGGISAGDHVFYRVALDASKSEASCYTKNMIPDSVKDDASTLRGGSTFVLYITGDDEAELDTGGIVIPGAATDTGYKFTGDSVDVEYLPGMTIVDSDHDGIDDSTDMMVDADKDGVDDKTDTSVDTDMDGKDDRFEDNLVDADMDGQDDRQVTLPSGTKFTTSTTITVDMTIDGASISGTVTSVAAHKCEGSICTKDLDSSCTRTTDFKGVEIEQASVSLGNATQQGGTP